MSQTQQEGLRKQRKCSNCKEVKDLETGFYSNKSIRGGKDYYCIPCRKADSKFYWQHIVLTPERHERIKEQTRARTRAYALRKYGLTYVPRHIKEARREARLREQSCVT